MALATFRTMAVSSSASPGAGKAREANCRRPWWLVYEASFSMKAAPGSTMSAAAARSVISTPCTMSVPICPAFLAATIQLVSPSEPAGPGSNTYSTLTPPALTACCSPASVGAPSTSPTSPSIFAPATLGASTGGTTNFVLAGWALAETVQATSNACCAVSPSRAWPSLAKTKSSS